MGLIEQIQAANSPKSPVTVKNSDWLRLIEGYRLVNDGSWELDFYQLERIYLKAVEARRVGKSEIVVIDHNTILIKQKRVEGLTSLQLAILEYLCTAGRASRDSLLEDVWRKPDISMSAVCIMIKKISEKLSKYGAKIQRDKTGLYEVKVFGKRDN